MYKDDLALNNPQKLICQQSNQPKELWLLSSPIYGSNRNFTVYKQMTYVNYDHHHVTLSARISLSLSRHTSLLSIAKGRSSWLHLIPAQSCCT